MKAVIFGCGKIARGFIAHLLYLSDFELVFVDVNAGLIEQLNTRKQYHVHIMGAPEKDCDIQGVSGLLLSDIKGIAKQLVDADIAFTAVGGKNLPQLGDVLANSFKARFDASPITKPLSIITCENWKEPAAVLKEEIRKQLSGIIQDSGNLGDSGNTRDTEISGNKGDYLSIFDEWVGISEAVVMRSAVEPSREMLEQDPLCVRVQDFWELPVDLSRIKGQPVLFKGGQYIDHFYGFLERKFYTYNAANGTVSYLGYLKKHVLISEAAKDPDILPILEGVYEETNQALVSKHHCSEQEQRVFAASSKKKLQDPNIIDSIERNARDPIRKLGPNDRLVGSAKLAMEYGIVPHHLATAIAAAIHYDHPSDPIAQELSRIRETDGVDEIVRTICQLSLDDPLASLIKDKIQDLKAKGWIE